MKHRSHSFILVLLVLASLALHSVPAAADADPFTPPNFPTPSFGLKTYDVTTFGATGNGSVNDTPAINHAIEEMQRQRRGHQNHVPRR